MTTRELQEVSNTVDGDEAAADEHDPLAIDVPLVIPNQINESDKTMNDDPDQNESSNTTQDAQNILTEFGVVGGSGQNVSPTSPNDHDTQQIMSEFDIANGSGLNLPPTSGNGTHKTLKESKNVHGSFEGFC